MALVKCKECGTEVSSSAKACPKCGAKPPKKTSMFTWLVLVVVLVAVYSSFSTDTGTRSPTTSTASQGSSSDSSSRPDSAESAKVAEIKSPAWGTFDSSDEMSGDKSSYAVSPKTTPTRQMGFPYQGVKAQLAVGCDGSSEWAYLHFTESPNLSNTKTKDGYNLVKTRVRWDDNVVNEEMSQDWGAQFIHFQNRAAAISKIAGSSSVMVELDWHGEGAVRFPFTLNGSSAAIQKIRSECANY